MHADHFGDQRLRADAVADLPAGGVERLAERADHDRALAQFGIAQQALVAAAVEDDVLVDLVADQDDVGAVDDRRQLPHVVGRPRRAGRVVRRVDENRARARRDRAPHLVPVHRVIRIAQADEHRRAAAQANHRHVRVVARLEQHHLVAGLHEGGQRREQARPSRRTSRRLRSSGRTSARTAARPSPRCPRAAPARRASARTGCGPRASPGPPPRPAPDRSRSRETPATG